MTDAVIRRYTLTAVNFVRLPAVSRSLICCACSCLVHVSAIAGQDFNSDPAGPALTIFPDLPAPLNVAYLLDADLEMSLAQRRFVLTQYDGYLASYNQLRRQHGQRYAALYYDCREIPLQRPEDGAVRPYVDAHQELRRAIADLDSAFIAQIRSVVSDMQQSALSRIEYRRAWDRLLSDASVAKWLSPLHLVDLDTVVSHPDLGLDQAVIVEIMPGYRAEVMGILDDLAREMTEARRTWFETMKDTEFGLSGPDAPPYERTLFHRSLRAWVDATEPCAAVLERLISVNRRTMTSVKALVSPARLRTIQQWRLLATTSTMGIGGVQIESTIELALASDDVAQVKKDRLGALAADYGHRITPFLNDLLEHEENILLKRRPSTGERSFTSSVANDVNVAHGVRIDAYAVMGEALRTVRDVMTREVASELFKTAPRPTALVDALEASLPIDEEPLGVLDLASLNCQGIDFLPPAWAQDDLQGVIALADIDEEHRAAIASAHEAYAAKYEERLDDMYARLSPMVVGAVEHVHPVQKHFVYTYLDEGEIEDVVRLLRQALGELNAIDDDLINQIAVSLPKEQGDVLHPLLTWSREVMRLQRFFVPRQGQLHSAEAYVDVIALAAAHASDPTVKSQLLTVLAEHAPPAEKSARALQLDRLDVWKALRIVEALEGTAEWSITTRDAPVDHEEWLRNRQRQWEHILAMRDTAATAARRESGARLAMRELNRTVMGRIEDIFGPESEADLGGQYHQRTALNAIQEVQPFESQLDHIAASATDQGLMSTEALIVDMNDARETIARCRAAMIKLYLEAGASPSFDQPEAAFQRELARARIIEDARHAVDRIRYLLDAGAGTARSGAK